MGLSITWNENNQLLCQCGIHVLGELGISGEIEDYSKINWKELIASFKIAVISRFAGRPIILSDRIDNWNPEGRIRTRHIMQALVDEGEICSILPPIWNVGYPDHCIQMIVWYPFGYITEIKDNKRTKESLSLKESMNRFWPIPRFEEQRDKLVLYPILPKKIDASA